MTKLERTILANKAAGHRWDYGRKHAADEGRWVRARAALLDAGYMLMTEGLRPRWEITEAGRAALGAT